jgi:CRP/FNR family cyclic AMP-dependent transcriptional regulator
VEDAVIWIEAVGYAGTAFTILAYSMRRLMPLRIVAILSSVSFLVYAGLIGSAPLMLMEAVLLPINVWRLIELIRPASGWRNWGCMLRRYP